MNLGFPFAAARPGFRTWCREGRKRNFSPLLLVGRIFGRSFALRASVLNVRICRGALAAIEALQDYGNRLSGCGRATPAFHRVSPICEDRHYGDQNTTFQSRFMLTTVMP
jgi:hypothetical protein